MKSHTLDIVGFALGVVLSATCAADDWPYAKVSCNQEPGAITIEQLTVDDRAQVPNAAGVQDLYALTEVKTFHGPSGDQDAIVKKKDFWFKCRLIDAEYKVRISPWKFNAKVNGMCGAYSPSVELTIWRDQQRLMNKIVFAGFCNPPESESAIESVTLRENLKNALLLVSSTSGSAEKTIPFSLLPKMRREDIVGH